MSARPARSVWPVGGGRLNMFVCLYTDREKPEKNGQSAAPAASLPTPGNVLRRAVSKESQAYPQAVTPTVLMLVTCCMAS